MCLKVSSAKALSLNLTWRDSVPASAKVVLQQKLLDTMRLLCNRSRLCVVRASATVSCVTEISWVIGFQGIAGPAHPETVTPMARSVSAAVFRMSSRASVGSITQPPKTAPKPDTRAVQIAWSRY